MALTRITKGVIKPNENYDIRNIVSTGIITAVGLDINGNADISGNFSVGGVLTYEDVTSIDSVGIITAQKDIHVGAGVSAVGIVTAAAVDVDDFLDVGSNIKLGNAGVITATSFVGSGAALTGIDATAIKDSSGNVKVQAQASGAVHTGISSFGTINVGSGVTIESNGQATFTGIVTFGSGSTTIDNNVVNVGTALTLGHTQGLQFHTQNLHSAGFEINQINASGIITASEFRGDGSNLTGLASREVYGFTGIGNSLSLTTTNNGADNIDNATYVAFEESFIGPSGISFSINTSGNLIMTV